MKNSSDDSKSAETGKKSAEESAAGASDLHGTGTPQRTEADVQKSAGVPGSTNTTESDSYVTTRPKNASSIREHKVELARRRIEEGAYDSPEVRDAIVARLVDALTE